MKLSTEQKTRVRHIMRNKIQSIITPELVTEAVTGTEGHLDCMVEAAVEYAHSVNDRLKK